MLYNVSNDKYSNMKYTNSFDNKNIIDSIFDVECVNPLEKFQNNISLSSRFNIKSHYINYNIKDIETRFLSLNINSDIKHKIYNRLKTILKLKSEELIHLLAISNLNDSWISEIIEFSGINMSNLNIYNSNKISSDIERILIQHQTKDFFALDENFIKTVFIEGSKDFINICFKILNIDIINYHENEIDNIFMNKINDNLDNTNQTDQIININYIKLSSDDISLGIFENLSIPFIKIKNKLFFYDYNIIDGNSDTDNNSHHIKSSKTFISQNRLLAYIYLKNNCFYVKENKVNQFLQNNFDYINIFMNMMIEDTDYNFETNKPELYSLDHIFDSDIIEMAKEQKIDVIVLKNSQIKNRIEIEIIIV